MIKQWSLLLFGSFLGCFAQASQLCIAPIDDSYHRYGQYGEYEVKVNTKTYQVSHTQPIKVSNIRPNSTMQIVILQQGKAVESFPLRMTAQDRLCLVKNDLYPTWQLMPLNKSCQCK